MTKLNSKSFRSFKVFISKTLYFKSCEFKFMYQICVLVSHQYPLGMVIKSMYDCDREAHQRLCFRYIDRVTGRFAPKPVPPGTIRSKTIFRTGRFTPGRFAPFVKIEIKVFLRNENRF